MSKIGYARVSTKQQNLGRQIELLESEGTFKIFSDKESGSSRSRPGLEALLSFIREGDIVVVSELDRLGRSQQDLTDILQEIQQKGATIEVLNLPSLKGIEDDNLRRLINAFMLELYKYQSESERKRIRERQAQGIALAKQKGKYKGGKPKYQEHDPRLQHAFQLYQEGMTEKEVETITGINRRTFQRYRMKYNVQR
ncbi:recombinase family protein [Aerococcaceae bacterium NML190073]|nr:recombinase family protein [Aerococcaceae bacterium NML190073]MCW6675471.1 recombinase family protein [Aerococcaceae bacterium NML171108]